MTSTPLSLLASAALLASVALPAMAADKVTYQLDWLPGGDKAPIYVCIHQGFCADAGLEVTLEPGRGSSEAITKIATGTSDIGSAGIEALMAARVTESVPVTAVMNIFNTGPHAFYTTTESGITTLADVKGKSVATSPFTSSNVFLPLVLEENGMTEADITLTKADPGALGPLLMTGQSDAIIAWLTDVSRYQGQANEAGKELVILPWADAGLELYSASLVASDTFLTERPDVAKRFIAAFKQSLEFANENPDAAAEAVAAIVPELSAEDVKGSWLDASKLAFNDVTAQFGLGAFDADRLAATWTRVAAAQGLDAAALDPETVVDRSFMPAE
ncbi:ABC transporter substrate-binding protein [Marivita sp.]|jgi:NitT/TauT family transport system substrate-binding protein|uniref:ABC transporter substrate-binding protein n=1 Tax=Marivita sp. TaxID=2003365 RepID=UPI0026387C8E|nr:ABC transporter substrate-binding protein [Marivita sp.]